MSIGNWRHSCARNRNLHAQIVGVGQIEARTVGAGGVRFVVGAETAANRSLMVTKRIVGESDPGVDVLEFGICGEGMRHQRDRAVSVGRVDYLMQIVDRRGWIRCWG